MALALLYGQEMIQLSPRPNRSESAAAASGRGGMRGLGMPGLGLFVVGMVLFGTGEAFASPPPPSSPSGLDAAIRHAVLTRAGTDISRSSTSSDQLDYTQPGRLIEGPIHLALETVRYRAPAADQGDPWRMPAGGLLSTGTLAINIELSRYGVFYLAANLGDDLPRLDAVDGDTYFATGLSLRVTKNLSVFAEDFQPASMIVEVNDEQLAFEPPPFFSWDGHQISAGLRWEDSTWQVEGAAVLYTVSRTERESGVGFRVALSYRF
jgi:hypothetical protein